MMGLQIGRAWLEISWHPGRRGWDLHHAGWSFTLDVAAFGLQGGIAEKDPAPAIAPTPASADQ